MANNSSIEWTDATWNPMAGCSIVSPGCHHCYAMTMTKRLEAMGQEKYTGLVDKNGKWTGKINYSETDLAAPLKWRKPRRVFVNSMSDLFHESIPFEWIDRVFAVMADCRNHTFQVLTKRAKRMAQYFGERTLGDVYTNILNMAAGERAWSKSPHDRLRSALRLTDKWKLEDGWESKSTPPQSWPLPNVWLGVSVEDQTRADQRIPWLLKTPAAVRFLSCEPLLGPVDLNVRIPYGDEGDHDHGYTLWNSLTGFRTHKAGGWTDDPPKKVDWVIVGGESGNGARPMHPDWARSLRDQCQTAGVAFHFKQWGEWQNGSSTSNNAAVLNNGMMVYPDTREGRETLDRSLTGKWGLYNATSMAKVGKSHAGRMLDGREWNEFPTVHQVQTA